MFYIFCVIMETGDLAQVAFAALQWSWELWDIVSNPFTSPDWFFSAILQNSIRFWTTLIMFFFRFVALVWVIKDSNARSSSFGFQFLSALIIILFTPIFGLPLYIAIRPQWWKRDKTPRRNILFQQIQECENCWSINQLSNAYCSNCGEALHTTCRECQNKYPKTYDYCSECGAPNLNEE